MGAVVAFLFSFPGVLVVLIKGSAGLPEQKCFKINVFSLVLNESSCAGKSVVRDEIWIEFKYKTTYKWLKYSEV